MDRTESIAEFRRSCRAALASLPEAEPEAWAFGATPAQADQLLALVLAGAKTATASSWREVHERYWRRHSANPRGFERDIPVVCEEFRLLFPR